MFQKLSILMLLALANSARGQFKVSVDVTPGWAKIGGEARVTCTIISTKNSSAEVDVVWVQRLEGEKNITGSVVEERDYEIGKNDLVHEKYRVWKKYEVVKNKFENKKNKRTYTLKVSDLQTTDSGQIGCRLVQNNVGVFKPLYVIAEPETILLKSSNLEHSEASIYHDKEKVHFQEDEKRHFSCVINKAYPIPHVSIMLGQKDISDRFEKSIKLTRKLNLNHQQSKGFISELFYDILLSAANLEIFHEFDQKSLACVVEYPGGEEGGSLYHGNTSIRVNLYGYKPKFMCDGGTIVVDKGNKEQNYDAHLHQGNFAIKCRVLGLPSVEKVTLQWKKAGGATVELSVNEMKGNHRLRVQDDKEDENAKLMVFSIGHLFPQHFRTYTLVASNSLGVTHYNIHINQLRALALEGPPSAAHGLYARLTVVLMGFVPFLGVC